MLAPKPQDYQHIMMCTACCVALSAYVAVNTPCLIMPAMTLPFTCHVASTRQQNNLKFLL